MAADAGHASNASAGANANANANPNAQSGIDILCDAAGSDMLMSSYFTVNQAAHQQPQQQSHHASHQSARRQSQPQPQHEPHLVPLHPQQQFAALPPQHDSPVSVKRSHSDALPSNPTHVCHICKRVYERADHLTRHLRSHENARHYQCSRCPKRFNRADLLTRHEATHDRDAGAKTRPLIRRSDRAAEACINCSSSKAKCSDEKPCTRCRSKNLHCQMPARRGVQYRTSDADIPASPSDASSAAPVPAGDQPFPLVSEHLVLPEADHGSAAGSSGMPNGPMFHGEGVPNQVPLATHGYTSEMMFFNPLQNPFQDMDFNWNFDFKGFTIPPQRDANNQQPPQTSVTPESKNSSRTVERDASQGHAAFMRSPWLWDPGVADYVSRAKVGLEMSDESFSHTLARPALTNDQLRHLRISPSSRDAVFAMVLNQHPHNKQPPSFPSLELLNYLLQAHFVQDERQCDSFLHMPSFEPDAAIPELLGGVIANGAMYISVPAIWQFGLALQEVVRIAVGLRFEGSNSNTRHLMSLQAYMFYLEVGQWCGFNRQMEICEAFLQPMVTMLRRSGKTVRAAESAALLPTDSDSADVLESKWKSFIERESFKRLTIHVFFHDAQTSIALCKNPLFSFTELCFSLPASRDLWKAASAQQWRDLYLAKSPFPSNGNIPRIAEVMHNLSLLEGIQDRIDMDLTYMTLLYGFWGQIFAHREASKMFNNGATSQRAAAHQAWLKAQQQEIYRDLCEFSTVVQVSCRSNPQLLLICELFMMILHVSPDDLQKFAGKSGEYEAWSVTHSLEGVWALGMESRYAVWHAGQVLRQARRMTPTTLRGFSAIGVYFAGLALWAYSLAVGSQQAREQSEDSKQYLSPTHVCLDGEQDEAARTFLQLNQGLPMLRPSMDPKSEAESIMKPNAALMVASGVLRDNFPVRDEPLPALVESLECLLHDLGSGMSRRSSRPSDEFS